MSNVRLAIIYYSTYGINHAMATIAAEAATEAGAEVRLRKVQETAPQSVVDGQPAWKEQAAKTADIPVATPDDLVWSNAMLFSAPTRFGTVASQMRAFIDTLGPIWQDGHLADKPVSAMSSAMNDHGGQEMTIIGMFTTFAHWGSIIVPAGFGDPSIYAAGGNPYGASHTANGQPLSDEKKAAIRYQAQRLVKVAEKLSA